MHLFSLILALFAAVSAISPEDTEIRPGVALFDTDGNRLYAGGANIWFENGLYYLVGEGRKTMSGVCSACINLYSSPDLGVWTFVGCILKNQDVVAPAPPKTNYRMERPKIFRCPSNNRLTMWFHCDQPDFSLKSVGDRKSVV